MFGRPRAEQLLEIAARTLREELLDVLPAEHRYAGLMVARAIDIARREVEARAADAEAEGTALARLLGAAPGTDVERLASELAARLRAGAAPGTQRSLREFFLHRAIAALRVSNPRYLRACGLE